MTIHRIILGLLLGLFLQTAWADPKLEGKWQSDHDLTMAFLRENVKLQDKTVAFLDQLMGHLSLSFGKQQVVAEMPVLSVKMGDSLHRLDGYHWQSAYRVVYRNAHAVVAVSREQGSGNEVAVKYNFVSPDVMWIYVGGTDKMFPDLHYREYYRRVRPNR